jgi:hypothetical protein
MGRKNGMTPISQERFSLSSIAHMSIAQKKERDLIGGIAVENQASFVAFPTVSWTPGSFRPQSIVYDAFSFNGIVLFGHAVTLTELSLHLRVDGQLRADVTYTEYALHVTSMFAVSR